MQHSCNHIIKLASSYEQIQLLPSMIGNNFKMHDKGHIEIQTSSMHNSKGILYVYRGITMKRRLLSLICVSNQQLSLANWTPLLQLAREIEASKILRQIMIGFIKPIVSKPVHYDGH